MGNPPVALDKPASTAQKVMWAAATLALSNIAALLKQVKEILETFIQIKATLPEQIPLWVFEIIIGIAVVVGNVILFRLLFERLKARLLPGKKIIAGLVSALVISVFLVINLFAIPDILVSPSLIKTRLLTEISRSQQPGESAGFRIYANKQDTKVDAWTTAQAMKAIFSASETLEEKEHLKSAFKFLDSQEFPEGWSALQKEEEPSPNDPNIRTEISCWVALVYLESLQKADFWTPTEWDSAAQKTAALIKHIAQLQHKETGAWAPVIGTDPKFDRTYPTMMAVWAISNALKTKEFPHDVKTSVGANLDAGISWLIEKYVPGYGWDENPLLHVPKRFDGLTFETLVVLKGAEDIPGHNSFKDTEAYKAIKRDIVNLVSNPFSVSDKTFVPSSDQVVNKKQAWATFLAYPWSLAALIALEGDKDISSSDQRKINRIKERELRELIGLPVYLKECETWEVAESLIGVSFIPKDKGRK